MKITTELLHRRAIHAHLERGQTQETVAHNYGVHLTTFQRWLSHYRKTGSYAAKTRGHKKRSLSEEHIKLVEKYIDKKADITLEEIKEKLPVSVCLMTIHRAVKQLGFNYKKNSTCGGTRMR
ncbi:MAG: helix-turn-helix domain-containing protein [Kiritimatiellae bacterium]|jgi:transposase|nr:helix-turn-helix domain-containing protein [Kiritimatiellia bacterium]